MKQILSKTAGLALLLTLGPGAAKAVQILSNQDLTLNLGGVFEQMGELENTTNNQSAPYYKTGASVTAPMGPRDNTRVFLFQTQDLLRLDGTFDGTKFYFEEDLGGTAVNTSNNQMNLYEAYADIPVPVLGNLSVVVGQFQVPSDLSSAEDPGDLLFTEVSPLFSNFFNQGYDNGVGLKDSGRGWDATVGTISGSPDLPQRYLPEDFQMPPLLYTRFGIGNIADDPYQQKQAVNGLKTSQWGLHFNGEYINNSNAGHSNDLALQNSAATAVSSNGVFGNALLWGNWNPYLSNTSAANGTNGPVNSNYFNSSVDAQYRGRLSADKTLILSGQWSFAEFNNNAMTPQLSNDYLQRATINLSGGELVAAVNADTWAMAARFDLVLPSNYLVYNSSVTSVSSNGKNYTTLPAYQPNSITGSLPIMELTFPSLTLRVNKYVRLTAEGLFWMNSPEVSGNDGTYELMEMPSQASNLFPGNATVHNPLVALGRMSLTVVF